MRLAGADVATASARASVKSLNSNSGLLLATRHCFVLDDPPENKTDLTESKRFIFIWIFNNVFQFCVSLLLSIFLKILVVVSQI